MQARGFPLPGKTGGPLADALRTGLTDYGIEVRTTREILQSYINVQNVYLSIFFSLGGLGLLLGTAGMIAVIARSVLERRAELGLMAASGFRPRTLVTLVTLEHVGLLAIGLLAGTAAALLAVAPNLTASQTSIPWLKLAILLLSVTAVGLVVCIITAKNSIGRQPMRALHEE